MVVLYGITLAPLEHNLREAYPTLMSPFYANDALFDGLSRKRAAQLKMIMDQGPDQGYFPETAKSLFIDDNLEDEDAERW